MHINLLRGQECQAILMEDRSLVPNCLLISCRGQRFPVRAVPDDKATKRPSDLLHSVADGVLRDLGRI